MEYIAENLKTPVMGKYDVIVVGGGPAGCGAAIAAGRKGAKVLLIEKCNCPGGMWTSGFVNPLFDSENKKEGIIREIINKLKEKNAWGGFREISFDYEYMKVILEDMLKQAGVEILYNTFYSSVICEENTVKGVICENISGRCAFLAGGVVDCSADGCVCADAGAEYEMGDDEGICQAMTLMFIVANVPEKYLNTDFMMYEQLKNAYEKENKVVPFRYPYMITIPNTNFAVVQFTHMHEYNPTDAKAISLATSEGRRQMIEAIELLKKYDKEFEKLNLVVSAPVLGVRESRRITGDYVLKLDDLLSGAQVYDGICDVKFNVDIHHGKNSSQKCFDVSCYQIPYRCLIPKGLENILVAGRCISGTHEAMASYRVTADCCMMGEAAGKAIAYAVKNNVRTRDVDIKNI